MNLRTFTMERFFFIFLFGAEHLAVVLNAGKLITWLAIGSAGYFQLR
jgi:hypothetical protein